MLTKAINLSVKMPCSEVLIGIAAEEMKKIIPHQITRLPDTPPCNNSSSISCAILIKTAGANACMGTKKSSTELLPLEDFQNKLKLRTYNEI